MAVRSKGHRVITATIQSKARQDRDHQNAYVRITTDTRVALQDVDDLLDAIAHRFGRDAAVKTNIITA